MSDSHSLINKVDTFIIKLQTARWYVNLYSTLGRQLPYLNLNYFVKYFLDFSIFCIMDNRRFIKFCVEISLFIWLFIITCLTKLNVFYLIVVFCIYNKILLSQLKCSINFRKYIFSAILNQLYTLVCGTNNCLSFLSVWS